MALAAGILVLAPGRLPGQVRKNCADGVTLRLNTALAVQGNLLMAEVAGVKPLAEYAGEWDGRAAPLWREGEKSGTLHGLIGMDLEKVPGRYAWKVSWKNAAGETKSCTAFVTVRAGKFPTERLTVEKQFVQPDPEQEKRAQEDQKKMRAIFETVTPERYWDGKFLMPLKGATSGGNFGRRRILNGEARSPHTGVDFPALAGTPVFSAQAGKVALAEELFYSGNTIVIDHGYGIYTLYAHLSEMEAKPGQMVSAGEEIGKVGATGRVTGPHLHWGLTVGRARVNAMQIVQREP
jgi:murein DD-endopeptidase MepM/ murein hydrolase activator NlpD